MNYLLVKREELGDKFPLAEMLPEPDGRVILPCNYIKVLAGVSVQVIGYQELIDLKESLKVSESADEKKVEDAVTKEEVVETETTDETPKVEETSDEVTGEGVVEQPNEEEGEKNNNPDLTEE